MEVGIGAGDLDRLVPEGRLQALFRLPVELDEGRLALALTSRKVWTPKPCIILSDRGIARSDIAHMIIWVDFGIRLMKSQKVSCADAAWG